MRKTENFVSDECSGEEKGKSNGMLSGA